MKMILQNEDDITAFSLLQTTNKYLHDDNKRYVCNCRITALSSLLRVVHCQYFFLPFPDCPPAHLQLLAWCPAQVISVL